MTFRYLLMIIKIVSFVYCFVIFNIFFCELGHIVKFSLFFVFLLRWLTRIFREIILWSEDTTSE